MCIRSQQQNGGGVGLRVHMNLVEISLSGIFLDTCGKTPYQSPEAVGRKSIPLIPERLALSIFSIGDCPFCHHKTAKYWCSIALGEGCFWRVLPSSLYPNSVSLSNAMLDSAPKQAGLLQIFSYLSVSA